MWITGEGFSSLQRQAHAQLGRAQKQLAVLRGRAVRTLRTVAEASATQRREWRRRFVGRLGSNSRPRLDRWSMRIMEAVGVATTGQVQRINRELAKISRKLDALAGDKSS